MISDTWLQMRGVEWVLYNPVKILSLKIEKAVQDGRGTGVPTGNHDLWQVNWQTFSHKDLPEKDLDLFGKKNCPWVHTLDSATKTTLLQIWG